MMNCWEKEWEDTPSFDTLRTQLKDMENQHKVN